MADTLNMLVSNKTNPKLIETNNFMIINGTLYQKSNLSSMKKAFSFGSDLGNNVLHISRSMHLTDGARKDNRTRIIDIKEDKYIENRSYIILNNQYADVNNNNTYVLSLNETDTDIEIIKSYNVTNLIFLEILCISQNYIVVSAKALYGYTNYHQSGYVFCLNKNDFTVAKSFQMGVSSEHYSDDIDKGNVFKLYEDEEYIYIAGNGQHQQYSASEVNRTDRITICKLNKNTLVHEYITVDNWEYLSDMNIPNWDTVNDVYEIDDKFYFFKRRITTNGTSYYPNDIYKIIIDTSKPLSNSMSNIKTNTYNNMKNIFYTTRTYTQAGYFIKDNYVFYYTADESNSSGNILEYQGLHKIAISRDFNLSYVKRINPSTTSRIISILFNEDYSILVIGYYESFDIMIYEEETQDYVKVGKSFTGIKNVGLDSLNRLWYETTSGEIHTENFDDPQDVVVEFEKPYYSYLSGELETYVTFKARSATGVVPTGRYILRITTGNAYFKESGTNELVINYESMSQDDIHYPLMITGSKRIVCNVSFEKVW